MRYWTSKNAVRLVKSVGRMPRSHRGNGENERFREILHLLQAFLHLSQGPLSYASPFSDESGQRALFASSNFNACGFKTTRRRVVETTYVYIPWLDPTHHTSLKCPECHGIPDDSTMRECALHEDQDMPFRE